MIGLNALRAMTAGMIALSALTSCSYKVYRLNTNQDIMISPPGEKKLDGNKLPLTILTISNIPYASDKKARPKISVKHQSPTTSLNQEIQVMSTPFGVKLQINLNYMDLYDNVTNKFDKDRFDQLINELREVVEILATPGAGNVLDDKYTGQENHKGKSIPPIGPGYDTWIIDAVFDHLRLPASFTLSRYGVSLNTTRYVAYLQPGMKLLKQSYETYRAGPIGSQVMKNQQIISIDKRQYQTAKSPLVTDRFLRDYIELGSKDKSLLADSYGAMEIQALLSWMKLKYLAVYYSANVFPLNGPTGGTYTEDCFPLLIATESFTRLNELKDKTVDEIIFGNDSDYKVLQRLFDRYYILIPIFFGKTGDEVMLQTTYGDVVGDRSYPEPHVLRRLYNNRYRCVKFSSDAEKDIPLLIADQIK